MTANGPRLVRRLTRRKLDNPPVEAAARPRTESSTLSVLTPGETGCHRSLGIRMDQPMLSGAASSASWFAHCIVPPITDIAQTAGRTGPTQSHAPVFGNVPRAGDTIRGACASSFHPGSGRSSLRLCWGR